VDKQKLHVAMEEYIRQHKQAVAEGKQKPQISNYIAECILKINQRLALAPKFARYTYIDEMISDGVQNSLEYLYNYNPEKYNNPFAYITQISFYAFIRRIQKEKRYLYIKMVVGRHQMIFDQETDQQSDMSDFANEFIEDFEKSQ
jgi:hypothetical protein